jgi:hypothetical protein
VPEGSPADTPPAEEQPTTTEDTQSEAVEGKAPQSVEEVEAIWKTRVSNKDKSHAAETKVLRDRLAALEATATAKAQSATEANSATDQWKTMYDAEVEARKRDQEAYAADVRSAKYPQAAEALDAMALVQMDEAKLAALNARLTEDEVPTGGPIDPSSPRRSQSPPKPVEAKSVAELEADLQKQGPGFVESILNG